MRGKGIHAIFMCDEPFKERIFLSRERVGSRRLFPGGKLGIGA